VGAFAAQGEMRSRMVIGALRHPKILIPAGPESSWQLNGAAEAAAPSKLPTQLFFRKL
jgi:hypothetical protein